MRWLNSWAKEGWVRTGAWKALQSAAMVTGYEVPGVA